MQFTRKTGFGLASLLALGLAAATGHPAQAASPYVYSQAYTSGIGAMASQNDPSVGGLGNFATTYDDFTLGSATSVTGANWTGAYFNPATKGTITSFTVTFYQNNVNQPGAALATQNITGTANETFLGNDVLSTGSYPVYTYSTTFTTPFNAQAGTKYWMSVQPTMTFPPQWGWESGTGGNGSASQDFKGTRGTIGNDMAFSLTGTPGSAPLATPEPSSVAAFAFTALGAGGLLFKARKRRTAA